MQSNVESRSEAPDVAEYLQRLQSVLPPLRDRMAAAALRVGRAEGEVTLVGVTKSHPSAAVEAALQAGLVDLGENRVQELTRKRAEFAGRRVRWHLIGHVQSRKSEEVLEIADLFHALDTEKLANRMSRQLDAKSQALDVLIQVNTSSEESKGGFSYDEGIDQIGPLLELPGLNVRGLMTMAPFTNDEQVIRTTFVRLRELHDRLRATLEYTGTELSMGMTNDFEIAIEEGSTLVRVGTALFGERK